MKLRWLCLVLCICVFNPSTTNNVLAASLAVSSATLTGRVTDPNGLVIAGAKVDATNVGTNVTFSSETNGEGFFVISNIPPGRYRVNVEKQGFKSIIKPDVELHVQDTIALNFTMQVGSIIQSVMVESGAPLVKTETAEVSTLVDRQFVENLPLNGRSFQSLITLTPGVVLTKTTFGEQGQFSVNGQRASANYFTVDGVSANIGVSPGTNAGQSTAGTLPGLSASGGTNNLVSVDALQEFKVLTSTYAPEFGRTPGAQVSIVTRSGTNEFRGSVFEYFRNDALDSNDWFANSRGLPKPTLRQNDFGGVLGGPLYLPRFGEGRPSFYNGQNRTFFFFSYEGLRLRLPQTRITAVPSLNARQIAPAGIQSFLNAFPRPNGRDLGSNFAEFSATYSDPSTLDATSVRVDHTVSTRLTLFARYNHAPSETVQRAVVGSLSALTFNPLNTQTLTVGATLVVTSAISNEFRANYSRNEGSDLYSIDNFGGAVPPPDSIIFPASRSSENSLFRLTFSGSNSSTLQQGRRELNLQRQINLVNNISIVTGTHQLKLGIDYRRLSPVFDFAQYNQQVQFTNVNEALAGRAQFVSITAFAGPLFPVFTNLSLFSQDTWRIAPRLTFTYGLRWEYNPSPSEKNGNDPFAVTGLDNPATLALAQRGTPLYETTNDNFAPRFGVAYQLSQRPGLETILRGGFGIFYDLGAGQTAGGFGVSFPNLVSKLVPGSFTPSGIPFPLDSTSAAPPTFPDPRNPTPPFGALFGVVDPKIKLPYTYQWNVAAEQSLGRNQTVSASYVAAAGRRLLRQEVLQRPNPNFSFVFATRNAAESDYHALQLQFQRRLSRRLQALASYTWSHSIDNASVDSSNEAPIGGTNRSLDRGPSDFDVRHAFNLAASYDIPVPSRSRLTKSLLGSFSIDTILTARSATPVNVVTGAATVGGFPGAGSVSRPDVLPGVPLYVGDSTVAGGRRINRDAFIIPVGRQGTLGRNSLRGFRVWQVDLALRRQFNLTERLNIQVRAEAFNIFNHPNFGDPGASQNGTNVVTSPQFGQSINMLGRSLGSGGVSGGFNPLYQIGGPRSVQLALKLRF
ncbi:MAG TPA: carboxypeptidase regulatory-like domain-containing protein [Pyrinomonadaceae bacterium]|nr:carboxypeptidase regulatory-like domain-containing protein [Pyrinomonadaceae bacterium]